MLLINLIVNYLYRKYGVSLHNFSENWTRGKSHLNARHPTFHFVHVHDATCMSVMILKKWHPNHKFLYQNSRLLQDSLHFFP